ncbi:peptidase M48 [Capnocytophaga canimorsus]|uniref:Peptidase M48 n=1 Tax=Capnocytophaga canimorsus TaxID=28188 RepID=A0A250G254_9FLAO|nr:M48 family metallopeptidase [Capnocytophaga canimorsus]ATA90815.1 peptidase M48 [Capnocytophaga canimorsus]
MKKISLVVLFLMVFSCKTNPFTGKSTLNFMPNSSLFPMAFSQYSSFLKQNEVIINTPESEMVKKVGERIAKAAKLWLDANGYKNYLKDYRWEYNLVKNNEVNAWCMPGGKIVVYTGILPITQNETGLAVVMGHEVAHALADHGAQRMSAGTLQQLVGVAGNIALHDSKYRDEFNIAYNVGSQVGVMLPFSRKHENEADAIGIQIMAIAGYNPEEAPKLWQRMQNGSGGQPLEFLSTHPSHQTRISKLSALIPSAKAEAAKYGITKSQ